MAGDAVSFDRLVRKEVSLGVVRERPRPAEHIGLAKIAPFLNVPTDDVIFEYIKGGYSESMAPARAEDAESELAQKDEMTSGQGRASVIDWAVKDKYTPSDISKFREAEFLQRLAQGSNPDSVNLTFTGSTVADFNARVAREDARRRRSLDTRLEWLIMTGVSTGVIAYNDGKIKFSVDFQRPSDQTAQAPLAYHGGPTDLWDAGTGHDPIGNFKAVQELMYERYGIRRFYAVTSQKVLDSLWLSSRFLSAAGVQVVGGTPSAPLDVNYLVPNFGPDAAQAAVTRATGITFTTYDAIYRTRAIGSTQWKNSRFTDERDIILIPVDEELGLDGPVYPGTEGTTADNQLGFAKTLTSPHPEGNWQSGFYEFEYEKVDPWMRVRGTGIKAFPVFPQLELSYTMRVLSSASVPVYPSTVDD